MCNINKPSCLDQHTKLKINNLSTDRAAGARFLTDRAAVHAVSKWLAQHGWTVVTSEIGYVPKNLPELNEAQRGEVGEFLQSLDDHEDVHRVWAAVK